MFNTAKVSSFVAKAACVSLLVSPNAFAIGIKKDSIVNLKVKSKEIVQNVETAGKNLDVCSFRLEVSTEANVIAEDDMIFFDGIKISDGVNDFTEIKPTNVGGYLTFSLHNPEISGTKLKIETDSWYSTVGELTQFAYGDLAVVLRALPCK